MDGAISMPICIMITWATAPVIEIEVIDIDAAAHRSCC
jgi:hypothetical protein